MDWKPRADGELLKRRKGEESSTSGENPSLHYHEIPSTLRDVLGLPGDDKGSMAFMDLMGIQDYASGSTGYSLFDLLQQPLPPPLELPSGPPRLPRPAATAPEPVEVVKNQTLTTADSSSFSLSSNEGETNKSAGLEEEGEEHSNNQEKTKKE